MAELRRNVVLSVDVGTASVRAAIFSLDGKKRGSHTASIRVCRDASRTTIFEQSTTEIWQAVSDCVRFLVREHCSTSDKVVGIGFDATCSLCCVDKHGRPESLSLNGDDERNVILWMDHRAAAEAETLRKQDGCGLQHAESSISPEMQIPKTMWIKTNLPNLWRRVTSGEAHLLDLSDYLTFKATGRIARSRCNIICKWNYGTGQSGTEGSVEIPNAERWDSTFLEQAALPELEHLLFERVHLENPGDAVGNGLCGEASIALALPVGTPVAAAAIDAYAGGVGCLSSVFRGLSLDTKSLQSIGEANNPLLDSVAIIGGTSACLMFSSSEPTRIRGIWGPYYGVMAPRMWTNEGGQSMSGAFLDYVVHTHPQYRQVCNMLGIDVEATSDSCCEVPVHKEVYAYLNLELKCLAKKGELSADQLSFLARNIHMTPDLQGNRAPCSNSRVRAGTLGTSANHGLQSFLLHYLAGVQALCYGIKHIVEVVCQERSRPIKRAVVTGGLIKNDVFIRELTNILQLDLLHPFEEEATLLGTAILAATAGDAFDSVPGAMLRMGAPCKVYHPSDEAEVLSFHERKYSIFKDLLALNLKAVELMN